MSDTLETRPCTCHPDDMTPPCERKYAYTDCKIQRLERERDAARAERDEARELLQRWLDHAEQREAYCGEESMRLFAATKAILGRAGGE